MFTPNTKISLDEKISLLYEEGILADQSLTFFKEIASELVLVHVKEEYQNYLQDKMNIEAWTMGIGTPKGIKEFQTVLANPFALYIQDKLNQLYIR